MDLYKGETILFEVKEIPIADILVENRARQNMPEIQALAESIQENTLLYPIILNEKLRLIEGERRLRAYEYLDWPSIPARIMPDLGADKEMIIELVGNAQREPFKWFEEISIKHRLHAYWKSQSSSAWGYRETAERLNVSIGGLSTDLQIAEAIVAFPELKQAETKRKAQDQYKQLIAQVKTMNSMKNLSPEEQAHLQSVLKGADADTVQIKKPNAQVLQAKHGDTEPDYLASGAGSPAEHQAELDDDSDETIISTLPKHNFGVESWETFIKNIPPRTVGFAELDPPYAIDYNANVKSSKASDWTIEKFQDHMLRLLPELYDRLIDDSWVICWTGREHIDFLNATAESVGFKTQRPGIWAKDSGSINSPSTTMVSTYETFLLFRKGGAIFNQKSFKNVIHLPGLHSTAKKHQWEKPFELCKYLCSQLAKPQTIFFSPFAGCGNAMVAAALDEMIPMGCDTEQKNIYTFYRTFKQYYI